MYIIDIIIIQTGPYKVDSHWERLGERSPDFETFGKIVQTSVEFTFPSSEFWFTCGTFGHRLGTFADGGQRKWMFPSVSYIYLELWLT